MTLETDLETSSESSVTATSPEESPAEPLKKKGLRLAWVRAGLGWLVWVGFGAWCVGQVFRDVIHLTALCFYIPSPLAAMGLGVWGVIDGRPLRQRLKWAGLILLPIGVTFLLENHWDRRGVSTEGKATQRVVHWNIYGSNFGIRNILDTVEPLHPDLMVFSEVPRKVPESRFRERFSEGYSHLRIEGMMIVARGELERLECPKLTQGSVGLVRWKEGERERTVMVADLPSSILIARDPVLRQLTELMAEYQPDVVVGDLNAPRLSRQLCRLPEGYRHAYDAVGSGWSATWPVRWPMHSVFRRVFESVLLAPLWSLDHCIISGRLKPLRYDLRTLPYSDHRLQFLEIEN